MRARHRVRLAVNLVNGATLAGVGVALAGRARVARVQRAARTAGRIYHLSGPVAYARDLVIRTMGAKRMLARQDWIYDWRA